MNWATQALNSSLVERAGDVRLYIRARNAQLINTCFPGSAYTGSSGGPGVCGLEEKVKNQKGLRAGTVWSPRQNAIVWDV